MNKKLHILFLCGWYPSRVLPNNGDFIQRHAEAVTLKHTVSVLHIVSDKNILKTEISIKNINEIQTYIGYVKHSNNPILKFIRFYLVYKEFIKKINAFDVIHLNILFPLGIIALHQKWFLKIPFIIFCLFFQQFIEVRTYFSRFSIPYFDIINLNNRQGSFCST